MLLVKSYEDFLNMLHDRYGNKERIVCLLFVDPFNEDELHDVLIILTNVQESMSISFVQDIIVIIKYVDLIQKIMLNL